MKRFAIALLLLVAVVAVADDVTDVYLSAMLQEAKGLAYEIRADASMLVTMADALHDGEIDDYTFWTLYQDYIYYLVDTAVRIETYVGNVERGM